MSPTVPSPTVPKIGRPQIVDEQGIPTRTRILAATREAIIANGYDAATLGEIAKAAQVSPPAIYNHFGSKGELFVESVRWALSSVEATGGFRDHAELLELDPREEIKEFRRLLVELHIAALRHPDLAQLLREWQEQDIAKWVDDDQGDAATARSYYVLVQGIALMDALNIDPSDDAVAKNIRRMFEAL